MSNDGLAVTPKGTIAAPGLYEEVEQGDEVARGHVAVKEIIAYDFVEKRKVIERDKLGNEIGSKWVIIENGRKPYFCQTKEQELIFMENNPGVRTEDSNSGVRTESFSIQLLKSTAIKYMNGPRNVEQFTKVSMRHEPAHAPTMEDMQSIEEPIPVLSEITEPVSIKPPVIAPVSPFVPEETVLTWRQQAKQLGIPMYRRTKLDVLADIAKQTTVSTC